MFLKTHLNHALANVFLGRAPSLSVRVFQSTDDLCLYSATPRAFILMAFFLSVRHSYGLFWWEVLCPHFAGSFFSFPLHTRFLFYGCWCKDLGPSFQSVARARFFRDHNAFVGPFSVVPFLPRPRSTPRFPPPLVHFPFKDQLVPSFLPFCPDSLTRVHFWTLIGPAPPHGPGFFPPGRRTIVTPRGFSAPLFHGGLFFSRFGCAL